MVARIVRPAVLLLLLHGCSQSGHTGPDAASGVDTDAGARGDSAPAEGGTGDPNGTFETAATLEVGDFPGVLDAVDGGDDADFFTFEGRAGQWVSIRSTEVAVLSVSDTVLTLYDAERTLLASNEYVTSLRGEQVLARIVTRLPRTGSYYVSVTDPQAAASAFGLAQPYRLSVVDLASVVDGYAVNQESGAEPAAATPTTFHSYPLPSGSVEDSFLVGEFSSADDVDVFSFVVGPSGLRLATTEVNEGGVDGDGSTTTAGRVWVTDPSGSTILGRIDHTTGQNFLNPSLDAGSYLLWVAHPDTELGTNDFYVVRTLIGPDNPPEASEATNGELASAELLTVEQRGTLLEAFVVAHVGDQDVDYFRFEAGTAQRASVFCSAAEDGSGLVGLHVSVRDEADQILGEGTDQPPASLEIKDIAVPASGLLYLRASKDGQLADVVGDWVRCAVYAQ